MFEVDVRYALWDVVGFVPVIYDMDFGHVSPVFPILSGSYVKVESENGKGTITYIQK